MSQCRIPGCTRPAWCRGLCAADYHAARRSGQLEALAAPSAKDGPRPYVVETDPALIPATRRRIKAGLCARPGCEARVADKRSRLCPACRQTWKYCPSCERVKSHGEFPAAAGEPFGISPYCAPCDQERRGRAATLTGPVRRRAVLLAEMDRCGARIARLLAAGMTWAQVAQATGLTPAAAQHRYYRWEARKAGQ